jgi:hypothetical protein
MNGILRFRFGFIALFAMCALIVMGCFSPLRSLVHMRAYENPSLRAQYEEEFRNRTLDPIEGFWRSSNQYVEGVGVTYRIDPAQNDGFPYAARSIMYNPK